MKVFLSAATEGCGGVDSTFDSGNSNVLKLSAGNSYTNLIKFTVNNVIQTLT